MYKIYVHVLWILLSIACFPVCHTDDHLNLCQLVVDSSDARSRNAIVHFWFVDNHYNVSTEDDSQGGNMTMYQQLKWWTWQWQLIGDTCDDNYELVTIRQEIISHCVVSAEGRKVLTNGQLNTRDWEMMATIDRSWWWWWLWWGLMLWVLVIGALRFILKVLPAIFCSKNVSSINNGGGSLKCKALSASNERVIEAASCFRKAGYHQRLVTMLALMPGPHPPKFTQFSPQSTLCTHTHTTTPSPPPSSWLLPFTSLF